MVAFIAFFWSNSADTLKLLLVIIPSSAGGSHAPNPVSGLSYKMVFIKGSYFKTGELSMYIGFLIVSPMDKGPSLSEYVKKGIDVIRSSGISHEVTSMGTILQSSSLDEIFDVSKAAADAIADAGSKRISMSLKVDIRLDKDITMDSKMAAVGGD